MWPQPPSTEQQAQSQATGEFEAETADVNSPPPVRPMSLIRVLSMRRVTIAELDAFVNTYGVGDVQVANALQIDKDALRHCRRVGYLSPGTSSQFVELQRLLEKVWKRVLGLCDGDSSDAQEWLRSPATFLDGKSPFEVVARGEEGVRKIVDIIDRIEYGVFA